MGFNGSQYKKNDVLTDLVIYFAYTVAHLPEVKLDKLIYIANLHHYSNHGELLTKTRYFSLSYGPHAPLIRSVLKKQLEEKSVYLMESRTSSDPVYSNPCLIIKADGHNGRKLPCLWLDTLKEVVETWGDKPYEHILDYTTRTIPYLSTDYRGVIDWTLIRPYQELKYALSLSKRLQIHNFVEGPEKVMFQQRPRSEWCLLSINEVAEIYLALRGDLPDKPPSQGSLGFKFQAVLHAFDKLRDNKEGGADKYQTEIEKAALLADLLLNSMSFRGYSSRVALITGLYFLKKSGFSFDEGVLENHWPDGDSYEILKEWFSRVGNK